MPHSVPRTLAFARPADDIDFIDVSGKANAQALQSAGIRYWGTDEFDFSYFGLQALLKQLRPDLIVCHFCSGPHFFGAIAYGQCPVAGIVMGSDVLYGQGDKKIPTLWPALIRMGLRRMSFISAKSKYLEHACRAHGVQSPIRVNYWGADTRKFRPRDRLEARQAVRLPAGSPVILSPRTISPLYNTDRIIQAMPAVLQRFPDALLVLVGIQVDQFRAEIDELVKSLGLKDNVRFIGKVGPEEIVDFYNASDVVVSMARTEGFPNTVLEVMCCGRPLIIGRLEQIEEILVDGQDCLMTDIASEEIASGIVRILGDNDLASRLSENASAKLDQFADIWENGKKFAENLDQYVQSEDKPGRFGLLTFRVAYFVSMIMQKMKFQ